GREQIGELADVLGSAEKQIAARLEREVEHRNDARLEVAAEIDQKVAAGDQVDPGERGVLDHAGRREDAHVADVFVDRVADIVAAEEALQPRFGDVFQQRPRITPGARHHQRVIIDVGGEDLYFRRDPQRIEVLTHQDRDRIDLLAGGAAGHPYSHRVARALALEDRRDHRL